MNDLDAIEARANAVRETARIVTGGFTEGSILATIVETDIPAMVKELRELRAERLELLGIVHSAESYAAGQISGDELCEEINRWSMSHDA